MRSFLIEPIRSVGNPISTKFTEILIHFLWLVTTHLFIMHHCIKNSLQVLHLFFLNAIFSGNKRLENRKYTNYRKLLERKLTGGMVKLNRVSIPSKSRPHAFQANNPVAPVYEIILKIHASDLIREPRCSFHPPARFNLALSKRKPPAQNEGASTWRYTPRDVRELLEFNRGSKIPRTGRKHKLV